MLRLLHLIVLSFNRDAWHLIASQRAVLETSIAAAVVAASQEVLPHLQGHVAVFSKRGIFGNQCCLAPPASVALAVLNSRSQPKGCNVVPHSTTATKLLHEDL